MRILWNLLLAILLSAVSAANHAGNAALAAETASPAVVKDLENAEQNYLRGQYEQSEIMANNLLVDMDYLDSQQSLRLYVLKCRLEVAYGRLDNVEKWLRKVHGADPQWQPNRYLDSPDTVAKWLKLKDELEAEQRLNTAKTVQQKNKNYRKRSQLTTALKPSSSKIALFG